MVQFQQIDILENNFDNDTRTIIENEVKNLDKKPNGHSYSEELKSFAVSFHFYSVQAYEYVRKFLCLPHPDTLRRWTSSHDVEPGFMSDVLTGLKDQLQNDQNMKDVAVMFDAMSIRKQVIFDSKRQSYAGYVNHGHLQVASSDALASESLAFLVVGLKKFFKVPFGYFLIDKIDAKQQAQLVKDAITLLSDSGFNVEAVVCDGSFTNQSTATVLGCDFKAEQMTTDINHPSVCHSVSFMFDACHLLKNVRSALGEMKILYAGGDKIEWRFITELHKLQSTSNLHLCNKLKGAHINYTKNKMKVSLAAQTLSSSVATAIDFLREDMKMPLVIS
jgi:hypothetical protein